MTLAVADLTVSAGPKTLVAGLSFDIAAGERVGLIGESGSGKSLTASAIMGLLPEELTAAGSVRLGGRELVGAPERELSRLRGRELSMVFQEPMTALNPTMRVGRQVAESMLLHRTRRDRRSAHAAAVELLDAVRLPDPARAASAYPHQLSGGQRQRVLLAIALANDPALLICDEPTTALDVTVQAQILELILAGVTRPERACERTNVTGRPRAAAPSLRGAVTSALLFITHDLAVVASVAQRVLVLYQGKIVEAGPTVDVLTTPRHDYTRRLLAASELEPRR